MENEPLNERRWQEWQCKNRESDRIGALRRRKGLQILLGLLVVAAVIQNFMR
jgi:hypothetical protein